MKIFNAYLKDRAPQYILLVLFALCIIVVNWLYGYPLNALLYALIICFVILLIYEIVVFVKYYTFTKNIKEMKSRIVYSIDNLPESPNSVAFEYSELLKILYDAKTDSENKYNVNYKEILDYYTMWAHQIKTPIQAMRLILQTEGIENNDLDLELLQIEQYVDMVITYLKLDDNSNDLLIRRQKLDPIIKAAVRKNAKSFIAKKISLEYDETGIEALTDEKWLQFVIEQILSNSLKYTQNGSVKIYKTDEQSFCIEDTGIGIAKDDLPRVFERGFTGYTGREDKKATGIGLFLCNKLLTKLGHTINIESEVGIGTKVTIGLKSDGLDVRD